MERLRATDSLEVLGVGIGVLLALAGLGTIAGMPWETARTTGSAAVTVVGALATLAVGLVLAWLTFKGR